MLDDLGRELDFYVCFNAIFLVGFSQNEIIKKPKKSFMFNRWFSQQNPEEMFLFVLMPFSSCVFL